MLFGDHAFASQQSPISQANQNASALRCADACVALFGGEWLMSEASLRTMELLQAPDSGGGGAALSRATDCDFQPSASPADDRANLDRAGIRRIVVNLADWPGGEPQRWKRAVRAVVDVAALRKIDIAELHDTGVRGVRVSIATAADLDGLPALAERIVARRWHIELDLRLRADRLLIADAEWTLMQLPVVLSFAHFAGYDPQIPLDHADVELVVELVRLGRAYVKLSEASRISAQPGADFKPFIETLLAQRKDRLIWGSGIRREQPPPAADTLSSSLDGWIADPIERNLILSRNPAQLYGFDTDG
jgi:predicted TIM-barrel fold metal-dependent hydrolase